MKESLILLGNVVSHYIKTNFFPVKLEGTKKLEYMYKNALHISLGSNVDHTEYCLFVADTAPYYGVIVKDFKTLQALKRYYRIETNKHSKVPSTVQMKVKNLPPTEVLIVMNATEFTTTRLKNILQAWTTEKPLLLIG